MAAQGFLPTHLKYVRGLYSKGQFITEMAKTLKDSESLYHFLMQWNMKHPRNGYQETTTSWSAHTQYFTQHQEEKIPNFTLNIAAKSDSQKQGSDKSFILKHPSKVFERGGTAASNAIWLCQKAEELLCLADM